MGPDPRCLFPEFDGALSMQEWKDALWAKLFTGAPESLDEDIVHPPAPATHADADLGLAQHACEG